MSADHAGSNRPWNGTLGTERARVMETFSRLIAEDLPRRLWGKDPTLWDHTGRSSEIRSRLGWLTAPSDLGPHLPQLLSFAQGVTSDGITDVVVLGVGGSALCAEVLAQTCGPAAGYPAMHVLDTTEPGAIAALEARLNLASSLFVVSSRSGSTPETLAQYHYFYGRLAARHGEEHAGRHFVAITGEDTALEAIAHDRGFRHIFRNPPDVGASYSVLSYFGLVPAALLGLDLYALLDRAENMMRRCGDQAPLEENPGLQLGATLAAFALAGRDKLTLDLPPNLSCLGLWLEQVIAESTGKHGRGIVPVAGEPLGPPDVYGEDRLFVHFYLESTPRDYQALHALEAAGFPTLHLTLRDTSDIAGEFFRWEFAAAVACAVLGVDPFARPALQETREATQRILWEVAQSDSLPEDHPAILDRGLMVFGAPRASTVPDALQGLLGSLKPGDYLAIMAFLPPGAAREGLDAIRLSIRDRHRVATTLAYGPRLLHATGQLHKGGPDGLVALQIVSTPDGDLAIPGADYGFATLFQAEALGDFQALADHGRRVLRVRLGDDIQGGLDTILAALQ